MSQMKIFLKQRIFWVVLSSISWISSFQFLENAFFELKQCSTCWTDMHQCKHTSEHKIGWVASCVLIFNLTFNWGFNRVSCNSNQFLTFLCCNKEIFLTKTSILIQTLTKGYFKLFSAFQTLCFIFPLSFPLSLSVEFFNLFVGFPVALTKKWDFQFQFNRESQIAVLFALNQTMLIQCSSN